MAALRVILFVVATIAVPGAVRALLPGDGIRARFSSRACPPCECASGPAPPIRCRTQRNDRGWWCWMPPGDTVCRYKPMRTDPTLTTCTVLR